MLRKIALISLACFAVLLCFASAALVWYFAFSFFELKYDLREWHTVSRILFVLVSFYSGCSFTNGLVKSLK